MIPEDWNKNWIASVCKDKGDAKRCSGVWLQPRYRINMLEHVMKVLERVTEVKVQGKLSSDDMQFGFMPGKGTTNAVFIVRQLQENYLAKKKELWMVFVDLRKLC